MHSELDAFPVGKNKSRCGKICMILILTARIPFLVYLRLSMTPYMKRHYLVGSKYRPQGSLRKRRS